jgi:hypothetical protein
LRTATGRKLESGDFTTRHLSGRSARVLAFGLAFIREIREIRGPSSNPNSGCPRPTRFQASFDSLKFRSHAASKTVMLRSIPHASQKRSQPRISQRGKAAIKKDVFDRMNRIDRIRLGPAAIVLFFPNPVHPVHPVNFTPKMNGAGRWQAGIDGNEQTT